MSLPEILKEAKDEIEECKKILNRLAELEKEAEQINRANDILEQEIKRLKEFLFYLLFADFPKIKTNEFTLNVIKSQQRAVFCNMSYRLSELYKTSLSEFLKEVVKLIKAKLEKEQVWLIKRIEENKRRHQELKEVYDLLKGLKVFMKALKSKSK